MIRDIERISETPPPDPTVTFSWDVMFKVTMKLKFELPFFDSGFTWSEIRT